MIRTPAFSAALFVLAIGACERAPAPAPDALPPQEDVTGPAEIAAPAEAETPTVKVEQTQNGDRACYLVLEDGETLPADFDICAMDLTGKTIRYKTEQTPIQSMDCEGNPDCALSDIVDLVVSVEVVDAE